MLCESRRMNICEISDDESEISLLTVNSENAVSRPSLQDYKPVKEIVRRLQQKTSTSWRIRLHRLQCLH